MMIFEARQLRVSFPDRSRKRPFGRTPQIEVLRGIDLELRAGEAVGVVGESGSGKSTLARSLLRLNPIASGTLAFEGRDITSLGEAELRPLRHRMQMIFQDSQSSLNPRRTVGSIVAEPLSIGNEPLAPALARARAGELLEQAGLGAGYASRYPHQLSGGQRQRVGIARAMASQPSVIVADEVVSGLDVTVQAQVLQLLDSLRRSANLAVILISHDLSVVRATCDRVVVMRAGEIVESGPCAQVFDQPSHPYTRRLLRSIPLPEIDPEWLARTDVDESA
jgi:peptide/nickel transport system ATP-binding protein